MSVAIVNKKVGSIGFLSLSLVITAVSLTSIKTGLPWRANPTPYDEAIKVMKRALELGANFWNAGEFYRPPHADSLQLPEYYFTKYAEDSEKVVLSVKGGMGLNGPDGSPEGIRASVDNCLRLLNGKVFISVFKPTRIDPNTPIETTIATLAKYICQGWQDRRH